MIKLKKQVLGYSILTLAAVIWGLDNAVIKIGLRDIPPITFTFFRYLIASLLFGLIFIFSKISGFLEKKDVLKVVFLALLNSVLGMVFINLGLNYTTVSNVSIINSLLPPILIAFLAWLFLKEKLSKLNVIGILAAGLGVAFIINVFDGLKELTESQYFIGNVFALMSALSWAVYNIVGKNIFRKYNFLTVTAYIFFLGSFLLLPFMIWEVSNNNLTISLTSILAVLYDGILAGFVAYLCWNNGLRLISASKAGIFSYLTAVSGVMAGVIFLKEIITYQVIIGSGLTFFGLYLTTRNEVKK